MAEWPGVMLAVLSSALGGSAAAVTRYLVGGADPFALGIIRFGLGFLCVLPVALLMRVRWPARRDWPGVAGLGLLFYGFAMILYNIAIGYTTAARAALALSTLPLQTMLVGALLGIEPLTARKTLGVVIATAGVAAALSTGLAHAPAGAWRGELLMLGTALCMAFYNIWSRPFIERSSAFGFLTVGMGAGALALVAAGAVAGSFAGLPAIISRDWFATIYLGLAGGAFAFILWILALQRTSPTRVAITMTVNPLSAALLAAALVAEPVTVNFLFGLAVVGVGIWLAATTPRPPAPARGGEKRPS